MSEGNDSGLSLSLELGIADVVSSLIGLYGDRQQQQHERAMAVEERRQEMERLAHELTRDRQQQEHELEMQRDKLDRLREAQRDALDTWRQVSLEEARSQRQSRLEEFQRDRSIEQWPLKLFPWEILQTHGDRIEVPLRAIVAWEPMPECPQLPETIDAVDRDLQIFLGDRYGRNTPQAVEFLSEAWKSDFRPKGAVVKRVIDTLRSEPMLLLLWTKVRQNLTLEFAYWSGIGNFVARRIVLPKVPYGGLMQALERGELSEEQIDDYFIALHCLLAGFFADIHYLLLYNYTPKLPGLLSKLLSKLLSNFLEDNTSQELLAWVAKGYSALTEAMAEERLALMPELLLALAEELSCLSDSSLAREQVQMSLQYWLRLRGTNAGAGLPQLLAAAEEICTREDTVYFERTNDCLQRIGETWQFGWEPLEQRECLARERAKRQQQQEQQQQQDENSQCRMQEFVAIAANERGEETNRSTKKAEICKEKLPGGVELEMVKIPGGRFQMGSPDSEEGRRSSEGPQHWVSMPTFYLGKYTVTQAQWAAIAGKNPSCFEGTNRPVECVSWNDAVAFCRKLSDFIGKEYWLPSEAEWEYACRAGTTAPFYFGETLTPDLANYDGSSAYGSGPKGTYRQQTTDVGSFPPNAFGLYDMHGNVWEWCADRWHDSYDGAPDDGSARSSDNKRAFYLLRGGPWGCGPKRCRSASRHNAEADSRYNYIGFRVATPSFANFQ